MEASSTLPTGEGRPPKPNQKESKDVVEDEAEAQPGAIPPSQRDASLALTNDSENRRSVTSETSRQSLRRDVRRLRRSLTVPERAYLNELCESGTDNQIQTAHETLMDEDGAFFPMMNVSWGGEKSTALNLDDDDDDLSDSLASYEENPYRTDSGASPPPAEVASVGSEQRQKALEERRQNLLVGKLWKAHQTGLSLSVEGSLRRSLVRHASLTLDASRSSSAGGSSYQRRLDEIFRARRSSSNGGGFRTRSNGSAGSLLLGRVSPRSLRNGSLGRSDNSSLSRRGLGGGPLTGLVPSSFGTKPRAASITVGAPPPPRPFPRPLRRMLSEGSTGSVARRVTFGALPTNRPLLDLTEDSSSQLNDDEGASQQRPPPPSSSAAAPANRFLQHRDSVSSIPSLHLAHPVRSPASSVVLSQGSLVSSLSQQASFPSIHLAHSIHDASSVSFRLRQDSGVDDNSILTNQDFSIVPDDEKAAAATAADREAGGSSSSGMEEKKEESDGKIRPVVMGDASVSSYLGMGIEVQDSAEKELTFPGAAGLDGSDKQGLWLNDPSLLRHHRQELPAQAPGGDGTDLESRLESLVSFGESEAPGLSLLVSSSSYDETMNHNHRFASIFRRTMRRSLSDADLAGIFLGGSKLLLRESSSVRDVNPDDSSSWIMDDEEESLDYYDAWKVIEDEYENGYGGGSTLPFQILGTSADDVDAHPHVLSPPLIESLQAFMPHSQSRNNVWMKFSLVRDGANMMTFLQRARGSKYTILAMETIEGEVFGAFTSEAWRLNWQTFGGGESFLWRMRRSRRVKCRSIIDQAHMESLVDVYPYTGANNYIQFCTRERIAVGGGSPTTEEESPEADVQASHKHHEWGFGLSLSPDLLTGTSSPCLTFASPSLSTAHKDGSVFEVINMELWTVRNLKRRSG
jgi:hypothetical protein